MTIKYKLGFTIDSQTLFSIISKFLPVDDLSVEEVVVRAPQLNDGPRFDKRFDLPKPVRARQVRRSKGSGYRLNPFAGANLVIMTVLGDGEIHRSIEFHAPIEAARYTINGLSGKLDRLRRHGLIFSPGKGYWQLTPKGVEVWSNLPPITEANSLNPLGN